MDYDIFREVWVISGLVQKAFKVFGVSLEGLSVWNSHDNGRSENRLQHECQYESPHLDQLSLTGEMKNDRKYKKMRASHRC